MSNLNFNFKSMYFVPFGREVRMSFDRDQKAFVDFSPIYNSDFRETLVKKLVSCDERINPKILIQKQKENTQKRYEFLSMIDTLSLSIGRYVSLAGISLTAKDLHLAELRKQARNGDAESVSPMLKDVKKQLAPFLSKLEAVGYTSEKQEMVNDCILKIDASLEQKRLIDDEREQLVKANASLLNDTWNIIDGILKTGKALFKNDKTRYNDYVKERILKKIIREKNGESDEPGTNGDAKAK